MLLTITLKGSVKFRTLAKESKIREEIRKEPHQAPSHVTLRNWTLKIGYYELTHPKKKSRDWIILLDHSIQFGCEKIFVVVGIRESKFLKLNRPLTYTDLSTLLVINKGGWNGELVANELKKLEATIGKIKYAVGDYGSDLRKGLESSKIPHVHDLSHLVALATKKLYENDNRFIEFKSKMNAVRSKFAQTDIAAVVPPKGRKKSEYQSFDKLIGWSYAALNLINNKLNSPDQLSHLEEYFETKTLDRIKAELSWLNEYSELITELSQISHSIKEVEKELKYHGLSKLSIAKCEKALAKLKSNKGKKLKNIVLLKLNHQIQLLPHTERILFSSDILESIFGKYKNRVSENPMASITSLILIIAAFTCNLTEENVKKSIENVKMSDIQRWADKNIPLSLFKKRKILFAEGEYGKTGGTFLSKIAHF